MATIKLGEQDIHTVGQLPQVGDDAPDFTLCGVDLQDRGLDDLDGTLVLNIFPSLDTGVCAQSVRTFNERAAGLDGVTVLSVSADLPFAHKRFCGAEGIERAVGLSTFRSDFPTDYGVEIADGPMAGLCSRAVVVIGPDHKVVYTEQVPAIGDEPDYDAALEAAAA